MKIAHKTTYKKYERRKTCGVRDYSQQSKYFLQFHAALIKRQSRDFFFTKCKFVEQVLTPK